MQEGRLLGMVVGALLVAGGAGYTPTAMAQSYCHNNQCHVTPIRPIPPPNLPIGGGGLGGGWGGGTENTDGPDPWEDPRMACHLLWTSLPANCDYRSPPPLLVNGCGAEGGVDVPDFLVSPNSAAVAASFGPIFRDACNLHDACYGSHGKSKLSCDNALKEDMILHAQARIPAELYPMFAAAVHGQASAYAAALKWEAIEPWTSGPAYERAQENSVCRGYAASARSYECNWPGL